VNEKGTHTLTVWKFPTATGAQEALDELLLLQREHTINVFDSAVLSWPEDRPSPETRELHHLDAEADPNRVWRAAFRLGFGIGDRVKGHFRDLGISGDVISTARARLEAGTSALALLTSGADSRKLAGSYTAIKGELIQSTATGRKARRLDDLIGPSD